METETKDNLTDNKHTESIMRTYEIAQETELLVQGKKAIDTYTELIWQIEPIQTDQFKAVRVTVKKQEVKKIGNAYGGLVAYMQELNKISEVIELQLGQYGNVSKVINDQEIWNKWQMARQALLANAPNPDDLQSIVKGGDSDYRNPTQMIKDTPLYKVFFSPLIGEKQPAADFKSLNVFGILPSQLYMGQKVEYEIFEKVVTINDFEMRLNQVARPVIAKANVFKEQFEKNYKALLGNTYNYRWNYEVEYHFNRPGNDLLYCKAAIIEETSPGLIHKNIFTIKAVN